MTYCLGLNLQQGLVLASDSRTNAGVDNVARFQKMRVFERTGDRVLVALSAGNLSVTQNALSMLELKARSQPDAPSMWNVTSMFEAARLLGEALRQARAMDEDYLRQRNIDSSATFILGGQVAGETPRMFMVYSEGNFIEALEDTPFFQIGEIKYGRPMLERIVTRQTSLGDGVKSALISFDTTIRSNLSVGAPIDLVVYRADSLCLDGKRRLMEDDPYLLRVNEAWDTGLRGVFETLPDSGWVAD